MQKPPTLSVVLQLQLLLLALLSLFANLASAIEAKVACIDADADLLATPGWLYASNINKQVCDDEADCIPDGPLDSPVDGVDHKGFVVVRGKANAGHQITWTRPSWDTTSEYLYLRYYVHKVPKSKSLFRVFGALESATALLDTTSDGRWKEACVPIRHDRADYRSILVYSDIPGQEYLALDKIIVVAPTDGSNLACSSTQVRQIKQFCEDMFQTTTTTTTTSTTTTSTTTTTTTSTTSEKTSLRPPTSTTWTTRPSESTALSEAPTSATPPRTSSTHKASTETSGEGTTTEVPYSSNKPEAGTIAVYVASAVVAGLLLVLGVKFVRSKFKSKTLGSKVIENVEAVEVTGADAVITTKKETDFSPVHFPANNGRNYFSNNFKTKQPRLNSNHV